MADKNMVYSMIFKIIDGASATIRNIANVMGEPTDAAGRLGDAVEKSGDRQVSAFRKVKDALGDVTESITRPITRMAELGRAAAQASEQFSRSFAGIGAIAASGFSLKNTAQQEEFFRRLQINTGMSITAIHELREQINQAADAYGVNHDKLMEAFGSFRANGGDIKTFGENAKGVAATIQLTGMEAENAGQMFAFLSTKMQVKSPAEFVSTLATMRQQLKGIPDGMDAFAEASMRLSASMQALHLNGAQGALALNAVYAVAARSSGGGGRRAMTATETWLGQLADRGYQNQLAQGLGQRITDANGYVMDPRILMQKMAEKYASVGALPANQQVVATQRLDALFGEAAARMFKSVGGEIKATGHSATIDKVLGAKGDGAEFMHKAGQASEGLSGSMNRLRLAMDRASESLFAEPINLFATALNKCTGVVAKIVLALASFVAIGQGIKWVVGAAEGFRVLAGIVPLVIDVIGALTIGFVQLTVAMLANPITWIVAGIVLVGVAVYELYQHWDSIWKGIGGAVKWVGDLIGPMFKNPFVSAILSVITPAMVLYNLPKMLGSSWTQVGETIASIWQSIRKAAEPVLDWIAKRWNEVWGQISKAGDWFSRVTGIGAAPAPGTSPSPESGSASNDNSGYAMFSGGVTGGGSGAGSGSGSGGARGHNLGNLRNTNGHGFQAFASDRDGAAAMGRQLLLYANRDHLNTVSQIITKYAPPNENRTGAYIQNVSRAMGVNANARLNLNDNATLAAMMHAMIRQEQGHDVLSMQDIGSVLTQGGGGHNLNSGGTGPMSTPQMAMRGGSRAPGSSAPVAAPSNIYGPSGAVVGAAASGPLMADASLSGGSGAGGGQAPRAHVVIELKDPKGHATMHVSHSSDMEAVLDRGRSMTLSFG